MEHGATERDELMEFKLYSSPTLADFFEVCSALPEDQREQYEAFTGEKYDPATVAAAYFLRPGMRWVLCVDGKAVVVAGFDKIREGVYQDWMFTTQQTWDVPAIWRTATRYVKRVMDAMFEQGAHRLQCVSLASRIHAHRWFKLIGLKAEGKLEAYGADGEDAFMFARVRKSED